MKIVYFLAVLQPPEEGLLWIKTPRNVPALRGFLISFHVSPQPMLHTIARLNQLIMFLILRSKLCRLLLPVSVRRILMSFSPANRNNIK